MQTRSSHLRFALRPAALTAAALAAALTAVAPTAHAQSASRLPGVYIDRDGRGSDSRGTEVYEWRGRVDREVRLQLRGARASVQRSGDADGRRSSGRVLNRLPREDGVIRVERRSGRGEVHVIQQPNSGNNYTAVLRLRDPSGGAGDYHVVAYWQPTRGAYARRGDDRRWDDRRYEAERRRRERERDRWDDDRDDRDSDDRRERRRRDRGRP